MPTVALLQEVELPILRVSVEENKLKKGLLKWSDACSELECYSLIGGFLYGSCASRKNDTSAAQDQR